MDDERELSRVHIASCSLSDNSALRLPEAAHIAPQARKRRRSGGDKGGQWDEREVEKESARESGIGTTALPEQRLA